MRYYENLFIVNPGYEDDALQAIKNEYSEFITENGGRVYSVDDWGKRRLAYSIDKQKYGTYVLIEFGAEGSIVRELEESQRLNDSVIAHLTVRLDEEPDLSKERKKYLDEEEDGESFEEDDDEDDEEEIDDSEEDEDGEDEETDDDEDEDKDEDEEEDEDEVDEEDEEEK
ncbi:MAG: 30S ribosomal protein S6 [Candidatus Marinimicrobia bacterium]|nr:30S ribosomal protein S6 [Candidatus Neomarinimicrobiota bacterium]MCF7829046.1 30S ribosomal protein S6 [Candidatus Neomarinimicrobiota bacterium]MCF7881817.1 30S ribosomal protein S6 [Candidatus Neomarinimicrobiota bacterium]